jgi:hypothetical protein
MTLDRLVSYFLIALAFGCITKIAVGIHTVDKATKEQQTLIQKKEIELKEKQNTLNKLRKQEEEENFIISTVTTFVNPFSVFIKLRQNPLRISTVFITLFITLVFFVAKLSCNFVPKKVIDFLNFIKQLLPRNYNRTIPIYRILMVCLILNCIITFAFQYFYIKQFEIYNSIIISINLFLLTMIYREIVLAKPCGKNYIKAFLKAFLKNNKLAEKQLTKLKQFLSTEESPVSN